MTFSDSIVTLGSCGCCPDLTRVVPPPGWNDDGQWGQPPSVAGAVKYEAIFDSLNPQSPWLYNLARVAFGNNSFPPCTGTVSVPNAQVMRIDVRMIYVGPVSIGSSSYPLPGSWSIPILGASVSNGPIIGDGATVKTSTVAGGGGSTGVVVTGPIIIGPNIEHAFKIGVRLTYTPLS